MSGMYEKHAICSLLTVWVYVASADFELRRITLVGVFPTPYPLWWASVAFMILSSGVKNTTVVIMYPASMGRFCKANTKA